MIVCEALDRLGRRLSDVTRLRDQLEFRGVKLHAVNLGRITAMHVGLLGTMAQLFLSDLKEKTRRGQLGRALAGRIPGGKAYGYRVVDGRSGEREIIDAEALVVTHLPRVRRGKIPASDCKGSEQGPYFSGRMGANGATPDPRSGRSRNRDPEQRDL